MIVWDKLTITNATESITLTPESNRLTSSKRLAAPTFYASGSDNLYGYLTGDQLRLGQGVSGSSSCTITKDEIQLASNSATVTLSATGLEISQVTATNITVTNTIEATNANITRSATINGYLKRNVPPNATLPIVAAQANSGAVQNISLHNSNNQLTLDLGNVALKANNVNFTNGSISRASIALLDASQDSTYAIDSGVLIMPVDNDDMLLIALSTNSFRLAESHGDHSLSFTYSGSAWNSNRTVIDIIAHTDQTRDSASLSYGIYQGTQAMMQSYGNEKFFFVKDPNVSTQLPLQGRILDRQLNSLTVDLPITNKNDTYRNLYAWIYYAYINNLKNVRYTYCVNDTVTETDPWPYETSNTWPASLGNKTFGIVRLNLDNFASDAKNRAIFRCPCGPIYFSAN